MQCDLFTADQVLSVEAQTISVPSRKYNSRSRSYPLGRLAGIVKLNSVRPVSRRDTNQSVWPLYHRRIRSTYSKEGK